MLCCAVLCCAVLRAADAVLLPAGGKEEAHEAYEEAYNAIFALQLQCHRHIQPHTKAEGTLRWEMIEMWPMPVGRPSAFSHRDLRR